MLGVVVLLVEVNINVRFLHFSHVWPIPWTFEAAVLKCLDLIDLDDSPFQAHLNLQRPNGQSMLHISASLGFHRLVAGLLARGANPDLRDRNGMSPMHMAALHGHSNIVRRLRLAGGDPTLRSLLGFTQRTWQLHEASSMQYKLCPQL